MINSHLSATATRRVNWTLIHDTLGVARDHLGLTRSDNSDHTSEHQALDREFIKHTFKIFKTEFESAASATRRVMRIVIVALLIAPALGIVGGILVFSQPWAGGAISTAALGTLFGLVLQVRSLARDQIMLEMIPAKYEAALLVTTTQEQFSKILDMMLEEMNSLQKK